MKKRIPIIVVILLLVGMLIAFPDKYVVSVANGLKLYAVCVLPALFPFFFFSKLLTGLNFGYDLGAATARPLRRLYNAPPVAGLILVMAMLSGYPIGAKMIMDNYEKGVISESEARAISSFTSTSGPLFIVGTVGIKMLDDKLCGYLILIAHYLATLINGLIYCSKSTSSAPLPPRPAVDKTHILGDSMLSSVVSVAIVGGYIAIFYMVCDVAESLRLTELLCRALAFTGTDRNLIYGAGLGLIEMTKGSMIISQTGLPLAVTAPFIGAIVTFGGLSVTAQSMTFLSACKIKPAYYLLTKSTQALFCYFFTRLLCLIFL